MWKMGMERRVALLGTILGAVALSALPVSPNWSSTKTPSLSLDKANARIGNPLSPGSIAGVNRRVNRRAARGAYGYGAAAIGAGTGYADTGYYGGGYGGLYAYAPGVYRRAARRAYYGYGAGYGAAALTGATLGYAAGNSYEYGYGRPYGSGYTGLYNYSPGSYGGGGGQGNYALVQFTSGHCEVWSNGYPSGSGWTTLTDGLPDWNAGEAAYHSARSQGVCN
jgi:hypothetical protein